MASKNRSLPRQKGKFPSFFDKAADTGGISTSPKKSSDTLPPDQNLDISEVRGSDRKAFSSFSSERGGLCLPLRVAVLSLFLSRCPNNSSLLIPRSLKIR